MDSLKIDVAFIVLVAATLLTGLSAGLCFIWTNTITPGIAKMDNLGYLQAFQHMNRVILNPLFFIVFFGPVFLLPLSTYLSKSSSPYALWILAAASAIYILGLGVVTVFGNVPLNEVLDKSQLINMSVEELQGLRESFEGKWNSLHLIRTFSSTAAFLLLILTCLFTSHTS